MRARRRHLAWLALLSSGCAWSNPDNRPVWNAFEANVVPSDDTAFYATLPLTVPVGLGAILLDTLVVHPVRVLDDAVGDAADEWKDLDWQQQYYSELGLLPLRVAGTPLVFLGSFVGRCLFDVPPHGSAKASDTPPPADAVTAAKAHADYLQFFAELARGATADLATDQQKPTWDDQLAQAFDTALRRASAPGRQRLYANARRLKMPPLVAEPWLGLSDQDPVVRYLELQMWRRGAEVPAALRDSLRNDASESVRALAAEKLP